MPGSISVYICSCLSIISPVNYNFALTTKEGNDIASKCRICPASGHQCKTRIVFVVSVQKYPHYPHNGYWWIRQMIYWMARLKSWSTLLVGAKIKIWTTFTDRWKSWKMEWKVDGSSCISEFVFTICRAWDDSRLLFLLSFSNGWTKLLNFDNRDWNSLKVDALPHKSSINCSYTIDWQRWSAECCCKRTSDPSALRIGWPWSYSRSPHPAKKYYLQKKINWNLSYFTILGDHKKQHCSIS